MSSFLRTSGFPKEFYEIVETKGGEAGQEGRLGKRKQWTRCHLGLVRQAMSELFMSQTLLFHMILFKFSNDVSKNIAEFDLTEVVS